MKPKTTLRRKLSAAFVGLVAVALLTGAVALYATLRWQATAADMETHYQRSLLLQRVRAGTFQALKEVDDALTNDVGDARADFERALAPAARDFAEWASLADTHAEEGEVVRIRAAHARLISNARKVFDLLPRDRAAAIRLVDDELDTGDYGNFQRLTDRAVEADRSRRRIVRTETARVRETTQVMLAVALLSIVSLTLLIAAYLSHDLFDPLRKLARTAQRLSVGDVKARAEDGRDDEIGDIGRALNAMAASISRNGGTRRISPDGDGSSHGLTLEIRDSLARIASQADPEDRALHLEIERLGAIAARLTDVEVPMALDLEQTNVAAAVHRAIEPFYGELADRAVSLEIDLAPYIGPVMADPIRLREALSEAIRNALAALPATGGRLGLRTLAGERAVRIEIADSGGGMEANLIDRVVDGAAGQRPGGLSRARAIIERHGGRLKLFSEPGKGTVAQLTLPDRR